MQSGCRPAWCCGAGECRRHQQREYEFLDGTSVNVAGAQMNVAPDAWTGEPGPGGNYEWAPAFTLCGEASVETGLDNFASSYAVKGALGIAVTF